MVGVGSLLMIQQTTSPLKALARNLFTAEKHCCLIILYYLIMIIIFNDYLNIWLDSHKKMIVKMCYQRKLGVLPGLAWVALSRENWYRFSSLIFRRMCIFENNTLILVHKQFAMPQSLDTKCSLDHEVSMVKFPMSGFPTSPLVSLALICILSSHSNSHSSFLFLILKHPNLSLSWHQCIP